MTQIYTHLCIEVIHVQWKEKSKAMVSLSDLTIVISSFLFFTPMPKFNNWLNKYIFIAYSVQGTVACHWGYLCKDEMFSVNLGLFI